MGVVSQIVGALIVLAALGDIFLTVFQGGSASIVSGHMNRIVWLAFRWMSGLKGIDRQRFLSYAGPTLVALTVILWVMLLVIGFAMIYWPAVGASIQADEGPTPTGFRTALYFSSMSLSTLGTGDIIAMSHSMRLLMSVQALLGFSVLTSSLTYMLSIYNALISHNSLGLALHHASGDEGTSIELVARFGAGGDFSAGQQEIGSLGRDLISVIESHHVYVVLRYFRLAQNAFALPRIAFLTLDAASLIHSAIDQDHYRTLVMSTSVGQFKGSGFQLLTELGESFLPEGASSSEEPTEEDITRWRKHFKRSLERFHQEGISVTSDVAASEDRYIEMRLDWQPQVDAFVNYLAYSPHEIDPDALLHISSDGEK